MIANLKEVVSVAEIRGRFLLGHVKIEMVTDLRLMWFVIGKKGLREK
jgi:hypothetical protein